jgi:hypothetical protein
MEPSKAAMKAALRVLTALNERQEPDPSDVDELHWYAPSDAERPLDELVCDAIQRAMQDRDLRRKAIKSQLRERALALSSANRESDAERVTRERQNYRELTAKLKLLGIALQQAAEANPEAARDMLESVAGDIDISGITELLKEHARLGRNVTADRQALKQDRTKQ